MQAAELCQLLAQHQSFPAAAQPTCWGWASPGDQFASSICRFCSVLSAIKKKIQKGLDCHSFGNYIKTKQNNNSKRKYHLIWIIFVFFQFGWNHVFKMTLMRKWCGYENLLPLAGFRCWWQLSCSEFLVPWREVKPESSLSSAIIFPRENGLLCPSSKGRQQVQRRNTSTAVTKANEKKSPSC